MYAAAVHEGKTRHEARVTSRLLSGWLEHAPEQLWIDLPEPTAEQLSELGERFGLHPLALEECDHTGVRPKIEQFERHLYLVLHGINHNEGADALDTVEFKIFLWKGHLVTVHNKPSSSIRATQERLQRDPRFLTRGGVDTVLHHIVDAVVDHYFPILERLEAELDQIEEQLFQDGGTELLERMLQLQRRFLTVQRLIHPQLDVLGALSSGRFPEVESEDLAYFRDVYDHLQRIHERVQVSREMLTGAMQCYLTQVSNRTNNVMKGLAVLATVALPATFLTSFLGMNLEHLPGRGSPTTFWLVIGFALLLSAAVLAALRRLRWL
ncbi:MAG: magnesium/cobalt transporter CorA [Armatimonadota bacterium]